jgi:succinyl-diaminopimelate desuccinylase
MHEDSASRIAHWLREHTEEMAGLIAELVTIPTENPPGNHYRRCSDLLQQRIHEAGFACERLESPAAGPNSSDGGICFLAQHGSGKRALYFHGHYDVVPAQSAEQFAVRREKDFLFGRGTCDMKGGIAAMLYAMRAIKECGVELHGRVVLALVCDEETGGERGSRWLARQGLLGRDGIGMLTAEPTSGVIWNANRGAITLKIVVHGRSAHVGLQHRGENAFERMHRVVERLMRLKHEVELRKTAHATDAERADEGRGETQKYGPRNSILLIGGQSGGGSNFNVVPERCWFTVDRRINPEEHLETEKARLLGVLEECKREGVPLEWDIFQEGPSAHCSEQEPLGRALAKSIEALTNEHARFEMCPGLLETRFYAALGVSAYAYGPGLLSVAHGPDEYVDLRRVAQCATIYARTAMELLTK